MNKLKYVITTALVAPGLLLAEGESSGLDLSSAEDAVDSIQTSVTSLFTGKIIPAVVAIAGVSFAAYIVIRAFGWGRKATK